MNGPMFFTLLMALLFGVVAGLRSLTTPAVVSWAVHLGWFDVAGTWAAFLGNFWVRWILTLLGVVELIADQLPATPSRTVPVQFGLRLVTGMLCGAVVGAAREMALAGALAGAVGAVIGTLGGSKVRSRLATTCHSDRPAGVIEDAVAIGGALLLGLAAR